MFEIRYQRLKSVFWWVLALNVALNLFVVFDVSNKLLDLENFEGLQKIISQSGRSRTEATVDQQKIVETYCVSHSIISAFPAGDKSTFSLSSGLTAIISGPNKFKTTLNDNAFEHFNFTFVIEPPLHDLSYVLPYLPIKNTLIAFLIRSGRLGPLIV